MFCARCGRPVADDARFCGACGAPRVPAAGEEADSALRYVLPVGRSGWAVAAGYLGLFSILLVPAPLALVCGLRALAELRREPKLLGRGRAWLGVVAGSIGTLGLLFVLVAVAVGD